MVDCRVAPLVACIVGAGACFVPNPLFFASGDESSGASTADVTGGAASSTTRPDITGSSADSSDGSDGTGLGPAVCGNGIHEPGEQCDDGNDVPGDDCEGNCRPLFRPDQPPIEGSAGATAIAIADLDGDGLDDIVLGGATCLDDQACVTLWHNQGDGAFVQTSDVILAEEPARIFVADWSGDGVPDILVTHTIGFISLIVDGVVDNVNLPGDLSAAIVARINDDALPDVLMPDPLGPALYYVLADGVSFGPVNVAPILHDPSRLAAADVDGDGVTDILYSINIGPTTGFALKLGIDGGDFGPFTSNAANARALAIGEFAAPPWPNVVYSDPVGDTLQVFNNQGGGQFIKASDTIDAEPDMLRLLAVRLNTEDADNIVALAPGALQIFTYDGDKIVAGPSRNFPGVGLDIAAGRLGGGPRPDLAVLTTMGVLLLLNQSAD